MKKLTKTQTLILNIAADRSDGNIEPLPENINAGIKPRVINSLLSRDLIDYVGDKHIINDTGLTAIGRKADKQTPATLSAKQPREGSKLAAIVALLKRDNGASLDELCEATGWLKHTIRGTMAGSLKKRFEYTIISEKKDGEPRRYSIGNNEDNKDTEYTGGS